MLYQNLKDGRKLSSEKGGGEPHFKTYDKLIPAKKFDSITILFKSYNKMKVGNHMHIKAYLAVSIELMARV